MTAYTGADSLGLIRGRLAVVPVDERLRKEQEGFPLVRHRAGRPFHIHRLFHDFRASDVSYK